MELRENTRVENYLIRAIDMVPNKIYPRYLLAKLYLDMGSNKIALSVAAEISGMNIKVNSPAVRDMKNEMDILLDSLQINP